MHIYLYLYLYIVEETLTGEITWKIDIGRRSESGKGGAH